MFIFNFKLFFKIAVAILGGGSLASSADTSVDTVASPDTQSIKTEVVINKEESVKGLKAIQWDEQLSDSLKINNKSVSIEKDI